MNQSQVGKRIGVACGGGFVRAISQVGVLKALEEAGIPIHGIAGCSAGSGVASAYAAGSLEQMHQRFVNSTSKQFRDIILEPTIPTRGLLKGERNRKFFEEFVGNKTFDQMDKELFIAATDLRDMHEVLLTEGLVGKAVQAATSVPGVFIPVHWDDMVLVDGGNYNLLPTKPLYDHGYDYVIAINTAQSPNPLTRNWSKLKQLLNLQPIVKSERKSGERMYIFNIIGRAFSVSSTHIKNFDPSSYPYDVMIQPDLVDVKRWHVSKAAYLMEKGYEAAQAAIPQIKKDLGL